MSFLLQTVIIILLITTVTSPNPAIPLPLPSTLVAASVAFLAAFIWDPKCWIFGTLSSSTLYVFFAIYWTLFFTILNFPQRYSYLYPGVLIVERCWSSYPPPCLLQRRHSPCILQCCCSCFIIVYLLLCIKRWHITYSSTYLYPNIDAVMIDIAFTNN